MNVSNVERKIEIRFPVHISSFVDSVGLHSSTMVWIYIQWETTLTWLSIITVYNIQILDISYIYTIRKDRGVHSNVKFFSQIELISKNFKNYKAFYMHALELFSCMKYLSAICVSECISLDVGVLYFKQCFIRPI